MHGVSRQTLVVLVLGAVMAIGVPLFLWSRPAPVDAPVDVASTPAESVAPPATPEPVAPSPARRARPNPPVTTPVAAEPAPPVAPTTATLRISSDVPGAQVFVDRKFIGEAPVTAEGVAPGARQINVSAPGYDGVAETHTVEVGPNDIVISLKTLRLDQSIAVIHKHRFGACEGQLIATPEGLRYETANTKDVFSVALTALETFDVDFVSNNLKVKVRGGRSYDFADPNDTADPLYFFQQAVDKIRQQLMKGRR